MPTYETPREALRDRAATRARNHPDAAAKKSALALVDAIDAGQVVAIPATWLADALWFAGLINASEVSKFREAPSELWALTPENTYQPA